VCRYANGTLNYLHVSSIQRRRFDNGLSAKTN
jgi:hypothetical protein